MEQDPPKTAYDDTGSRYWGSDPTALFVWKYDGPKDSASDYEKVVLWREVEERSCYALRVLCALLRQHVSYGAAGQTRAGCH